MKSVREVKIENAAVQWAKLNGWWVAKFTSPGKRAVPDRLFIKDGRHVFIEFKKVGEVPTEQQEKRHRDMRKHGAEVHWADSVEQVRGILDWEL